MLLRELCIDSLIEYINAAIKAKKTTEKANIRALNEITKEDDVEGIIEPKTISETNPKTVKAIIIPKNPLNIFLIDLITP